MATYITRTAAGQTLSTSYTTLTSNFGDSNLSLNVPTDVGSIRSLRIGVTCPNATGDFVTGLRLEGLGINQGQADFTGPALMNQVTTSGAAASEVSVNIPVDVPVQGGQTMSIKMASSVSAANCDICVELCFA
tara:strand:+ start:362 stop:760 length:399 start_codon:yes stop_codon:yes gene_type:complete